MLVLFILIAALTSVRGADELWVADSDNDVPVYRKMILPNGQPTNVNISTSVVSSLGCLDYDSKNDVLYVGSSDSPEVLAKVSTSDYSQVTTILTTTTNPGDFGPHSLAVDIATDTIYYADYDSSTIVSVKETTSSPISKVVVNETDATPRTIDIDYNYGLIFWTDYEATNRRMMCTAYDGTGTQKIADIIKGRGVGVDLHDQYVYWCDETSPGKLYRTKYDTAGCSSNFAVETVHIFGSDTFCKDVVVGTDTVYLIEIEQPPTGSVVSQHIKSFQKNAITGATTNLTMTTLGFTFTTDNFPIGLSLNEENPIVTSPCVGVTCNTGQACIPVSSGYRCLCNPGVQGCIDGSVVTVATNDGNDSTTKETSQENKSLILTGCMQWITVGVLLQIILL